MNAFGIGPNLYPLRLILPIVVLFFSVLLFQKVVLLKQKVSLQPVLIFSLLYFLYLFFHTYIVTFFRYTLFAYDYEFTSILNFTFLLVLIFALYNAFLSNRDRFFKVFNQITLVFYILYALYAFYEIFTGNHLSTSVLFDAPYWLTYSPTVVYFNSNDFASIFTLMFMYLLSTLDKEKKQSMIWLFAAVALHLLIVYYSQSRISLVVSLIYLLYRYPIKLASISVIGIFIIFILSFFTVSTDY